jgi:hypothetical protein
MELETILAYILAPSAVAGLAVRAFFDIKGDKRKDERDDNLLAQQKFNSEQSQILITSLRNHVAWIEERYEKLLARNLELEHENENSND